ncbi:MAG: hypothetical protein NT051_05735, partial [Candidatus Micrarchaeota archaeon]|nr:hypothetical protein [Candidatus Micrarchaeota archaeon]
MKSSYLVFAVALFLIALVFLSGCAGKSQQAENPKTPATPSAPSAPTATAGSLTATPSELAHFVSGQMGFAEFSSMISGGAPPYGCSLSSDSVLPSGLELGGDCTIFGTHILAPGTPTEISQPFTVLVSDSSQPALGTTLKLSITTDVEKPTFEPVVGSCTVGEQCNALVANAMGGTEPYTFSSGSYASSSGGAPPMGLTVGIDGRLAGTPSTSGAFRFSMCVKDSAGFSDCGETEVVIEPAPVKEACYIDGIETKKYPDEPVCCQHHVWCN